MRRRPLLTLTTDPAIYGDLRALSKAQRVPQARIADAALRTEIDRRAAALPADQRATYEAARAEAL